MQAIILAAGESSRFYPYNSLGHKSLVTIGGRTLFSRTLASLKRAKVTSVIVIESLDESASKSVTPKELEGMNVRFIIQEKPTGMGDAVLLAAKYLEKNFFVLSAYHFEVDLFVKEMMSSQKKDEDIVLLTKDAEDVTGFGAITRKNGKISVLEKKETGPAEKLIGIYLLNREFISVLHMQKRDHYSFEEALSAYSDAHDLILLKTEKDTLSLKYPWDILNVKDYILEHTKRNISKTATIAKNATVRGAVVVDAGATIMENAVITGPAYIGRDAYVGTHAVIRSGVVIEEEAVVGAHMEVKNAVLMQGVTTHSGFLGDSVVGVKTKIAAGFNTANVRLDRKNIRSVVKGEKVDTKKHQLGVLIGNNCAFGIKVGTMPGVIIGNNVVIGPGTTVMENVESNVTYYTEIKGIIKKKNS